MTRVLLASVGLSPQVVTETVWALAVAGNPVWEPDALHLLTTQEGAVRAEALLPAAFAALASAHGVASLWPPASVTLLPEDPEALEAAADVVSGLVGRLTADPGSALHVSLAGGRKTTAALLAVAMTLHGRPQDALSHVVASPALEGRADFFFPAGRTSEAVRLWPAPFPRLRHLIPGDAPARPGFRARVEQARAALEPVTLTLDPGRGSVLCGGEVLRLPPVLAAWLSLLAESGVEGVARSGTRRAAMAAWHRRWGGGAVRWPDPLDPDRPEEWSSRINKLVSSFISVKSGERLIETVGPRAHGRYRLNMKHARVEFVDERTEDRISDN